MKQFLGLFIFLIPGLIVGGIDRSPEHQYTGYAYPAAVQTVNAVFDNPSALYKLSDISFQISFTKSAESGPDGGIFHSFASAVVFSKTYVSALGVLSLPEENREKYRMGFSVIEWRYFNFGLSVGADRLTTHERAGLSFSPGFSGQIYDSKRSRFKAHWGLNAFDLLNINQFNKDKSTSFSDLVLEGGIRLQLFVRNLFLNLGGRYDLKSASRDASPLDASAGFQVTPFRFLDLGACAKMDEWSAGLTIHVAGHMAAFAWVSGFKGRGDFSIGYGFALSDRPKAAKKTWSSRKKQQQRLTPEMQIRQKELLEEGLRLYREKDYAAAKTVWDSCVTVWPKSQEAAEARQYIEKVKNILSELEE